MFEKKPPTELRHRIAMEVLGYTFEPEQDLKAERYCRNTGGSRGFLVAPDGSGTICVACDGNEVSLDDMINLIQELDLRFVLGRSLHRVGKDGATLGYTAHIWHADLPVTGLSDDTEAGLSSTPQEALARAILDWKKKFDKARLSAVIS